MSSRVAVVDSGANYASVAGALRRAGADFELVREPEQLAAASHVIVPGVGHAGEALDRLESFGLVDVLPTLTQPVLGICVGMQLMFETCAEADRPCLGVFEGSVTRLSPTPSLRVPHCGWNRLDFERPSPLTRGLDEDDAYVYFVHGYAATADAQTVASAEHGRRISAAVQRDNFFGVQFHPERSARTGRRILENFLAL